MEHLALAVNETPPRFVENKRKTKTTKLIIVAPVPLKFNVFVKVQTNAEKTKGQKRQLLRSESLQYRPKSLKKSAKSKTTLARGPDFSIPEETQV